MTRQRMPPGTYPAAEGLSTYPAGRTYSPSTKRQEIHKCGGRVSGAPFARLPPYGSFPVPDDGRPPVRACRGRRFSQHLKHLISQEQRANCVVPGGSAIQWGDADMTGVASTRKCGEKQFYPDRPPRSQPLGLAGECPDSVALLSLVGEYVGPAAG
jgi:hypothetical protein